MQRTLLHAKLHRVRVTGAELDYEGSCGIDLTLLERAGILPYERIEIYNVSNGERFATYAIPAERDSGAIAVNGAAAHKADVGDILIVCTYVQLAAAELEAYHPTVVLVDEHNHVREIRLATEAVAEEDA